MDMLEIINAKRFSHELSDELLFHGTNNFPQSD